MAPIVVLSLLFLLGTCRGEEREEREIQGHNPEPDTLEFLRPESVAALASFPYERLPRSVQELVRSARGDNSHWCCAVPTTRFIAHSTAELRYHKTSHKQAYYKGCGWWGWSRCKVFKVIYKHATHYGSSYRSVEVPVTCPDHKVVCCKSYIMVAEHCISVSKLAEVKGDLLKLQELGELSLSLK